MAQRTCLYCGGPLPEQGAGRPRKFCNDQCARRGAPSERREQVPCAACGTLVMRQPHRFKDGRQPTCSDRCKMLMRSNQSVLATEIPDDHPARWILGQQSTAVRFFDCSDCGALTCHMARQKLARYCPPCRQRRKATQRFISAECHVCGKWYVMDRQASSNLQDGAHVCSLRCERKLSRRKRDARKRAAYVEHVSPAYIYKRDRYTCQICGKRLAMSKQVPYATAPTLDHIIPLAKGGTHETANVQAAHFMCNALKSDGAAGDQLLLVG